MKNTSQGYPRNYTANTTGDILQVAEKIYFMAKVSTTPFSLGIYRISYGSPDKPGGLSIQLCKSEKKEFYIRYSS